MIAIDAPHFYAAIVHADGRVTRAAPIIGYMVGWTGAQVAEYCRRKGWRWGRVPC